MPEYSVKLTPTGRSKKRLVIPSPDLASATRQAIYETCEGHYAAIITEDGQPIAEYVKGRKVGEPERVREPLPDDGIPDDADWNN